VARGPYAKVAARNAALLARIRALRAGHPAWGYRRVWAHLRHIDGLMINPKRVYGVMKANDLLLTHQRRAGERAGAAGAARGR
jgi:putative transposase